MKQVGLIGLGVMGGNLALNMAEHGLQVTGFDTDPTARHRFRQSGAGIDVDSLAALVAALAPPRLLILLVPAGSLIDQLLDGLSPLLTPGDVIADASNSHFRDTERRAATTAAGVSFVGLGVSGGAAGARSGPSLMAGGRAEAVAIVREALAPLAPTVNAKPCFGYFGDGGAGHFVKMIHNGIEYADMQLIAESYFLLRHLFGHSPSEIARLFERWHQGPLEGYLLEISARVLDTQDQKTGHPLVDVIVDAAQHKGTGHWAAAAAMELGVPTPTIAEAVHARFLSATRDGWQNAATPQPAALTAACSQDDVRDALIGGKHCAYAQGFATLAAAKRQFGWPLDLAIVAQVWSAGSILQSRLLRDIASVLENAPDLANPLAAPEQRARVVAAAPGWRRCVGAAIAAGLPVPALASAIAYWDGSQSPRLWADLIQAQRDYFGAHGFARIDGDGVHHGPWSALP